MLGRLYTYENDCTNHSFLVLFVFYYSNHNLPIIFVNICENKGQNTTLFYFYYNKPRYIFPKDIHT